MINDNIHEPTQEEFRLVISNLRNAVLQEGGTTLTLVGEIQDDEAAPTLTIDDATFTEGDSGNMVFDVSLNRPGQFETSFQYYTVGKSSTNEQTATSDDDFTAVTGASQTSFTFDPGETGGSIEIVIIDDTLDEPDETFLLSPITTDKDKLIASVAQNATGTIVDNDLPAGEQRHLVFSPTSLNLNESDSGGTGTGYTVRLSHAPADDVTVTITTPAGSDLTLDETSLTFTPTTWETAQTVTVTPGQDDDAVRDREKITHTAAEISINDQPDFNGVTGDLPVTVRDDDNRSIILSPTALNVTEGSEGDDATADGSILSVRLGTQPTGNVTVRANWGGGSEISYSPAAGITFNKDNWKTPQELTFTAPNYGNIADETIQVRIWALGADYSGKHTFFQLTIVDDDDPAILTDPGELEVTEGDTDGETVDVTLAHQPMGTVTVTPQTSGTRFAASPTTLSFDEDDWDVPQELTVTGDHDDDADAETLTLDLTASGGGYDEAEGSVSITILDDDTLGVNVSEKSLNITEGQAASYAIVLGQLPTGDVTVTITVPSGAELTLGGDDVTATSTGGTLTFTTDNWSQTQTVTVTAGQDDDGEDEAAVTIGHSVSGGGYAGVTVDGITINVQDDDLPIVNTEFGEDSTSAPEGAEVTVLLKIDMTPDRPVELPLQVAYQGGTDSSDHTGIPEEMEFGPRETQKSFSFMVRDDQQSETGEGITLRFGQLPDRVQRKSDGNDMLLITFTDDDEAGVTIDPTTLNITEGATDTYGVVLKTQPSQDVTVTPAVPSGAELTVSPTSLAFDEDNWNDEQTVTVRAVHDEDGQDETAVNITHAVTGYGTLTAADPVAVTVTADDGPEVSVQFENSLYDVKEQDDDSTDETKENEVLIKVQLDKDPERQVVIPIAVTDADSDDLEDDDETNYASGDDYTLSAASVTFESGETEQTVKFTAADDSDNDDGDLVALAIGTLPPGVSTGTNYSSAVRIEDDDQPASLTVEFEKDEYSVQETDDTATTGVAENEAVIKIKLSESSGESVTVNLTATNQGGATAADYHLAATSVTFGATDTEKSVKFSATHDGLYDPDESVKLTFNNLPDNLSAGDTDETTITIEDDEIGVFFEQAAYSVKESDDADTTDISENQVTIKVKLSSAPGGTGQDIYIQGVGAGTADASDYDLSGSTADGGNAVNATVSFGAADTEKEVTFTATSDQTEEGNETVTLSIRDSLISAPYVATGNKTTVVTIEDDDTAGVTVNPTTLEIDEGSSKTYSLVLTSQPTHAVTVTAAKRAGSSDSITLSPSSVTFTASGDTRWDKPQNIQVSEPQDADADDSSATIEYSTSSTDPKYHQMPDIDRVMVTARDDEPEVTLSFDETSYEVTEGGNADIQVNADVDPDRAFIVPITITRGAGVTVFDYRTSQSYVRFTDGDTSATLRITAVDDAAHEQDETLTLGFPTALPAKVKTGTPGTTTVTIVDNDQGMVAISPTTLDVDEGDDNTYTVVLKTQPQEDVVITVTPPAANTDITVNKTTLTFTDTTWDDPQVVTVEAAQDDGYDDESGAITHSSASSDSDFNGIDVQSVTVNVDDDEIGVSFESAEYEVQESDDAGTTDVREDQVSIKVTLTEAPGEEKQVPITATGENRATAADFSISPTTLTFGATDTEQTITFTAAGDELDDDNETVRLAFGTLPAGVAPGDNAEAVVAIKDDDHPNITVKFRLASASVPEDGPSYASNIELSANPERRITIPFVVTNETASGSDYRLTPDNRRMVFGANERRKLIRIYPEDDDLDEDNETLLVTFGTNLPDRVTEGSRNSFRITIQDDDTSALVFTDTPVSVNEGSTATYKVRLATKPAGDVTVTLTDPGNTDITSNPDELEFDEDNWADDQTVTVSAAQDNDADDDTGDITHSVSSDDDAKYNALDDAAVAVTVTDDETGINFSSSNYSVTEGSSAKIAVVLTKPADGQVTAIIGSVGQRGATTPEDYTRIPRNVTFQDGESRAEFTVTAPADEVDDSGDYVALTLYRTAGNAVTGSRNTARLDIIDTTSVKASFENSTYTVQESDDPDTTGTRENEASIKVTLSRAPTEETVIPLTTVPGTGTTSGDYSGVPTGLTFQSGDTEKSFTFRAEPDSLDEADETLTVWFGTLPDGYAAGTNGTAQVTIMDADADHVTVKPTTLEVNEGGSNTYKVVLETKPAGNVTVTLARTGSSDVTFSPTTALAFTQDTWDDEQTVTVSAAEDADALDETATITHTVSGYGTVTKADDVAVTVKDNEPAVTVFFESAAYSIDEQDDETTTTVREDQAAVKIKLSQDPERQVALTILRTDQGGAVSGTDYSFAPTCHCVTFESGETEQTITYTALDDTADDGGESVNLAFQATLPTKVTPGTIRETVITIVDDDAGMVQVSPTVLNIGEGASKTYKVVLKSKPSHDVVITITEPANTDITADQDELTFTEDNWDDEQEVTVTVKQDDGHDDESGTITHTSASTDDDFNGISVDGVKVNVDDDEDPPDVSVEFGAAAYSVQESDDPDTTGDDEKENEVAVRVTLAQAPTGEVTIPISQTLGTGGRQRLLRGAGQPGIRLRREGEDLHL